MQDTFFVEGGRILRSHTSPVQIRTMLAGPPPVRIVAPGNVFRRDDDATHTPMFPQMEGAAASTRTSRSPISRARCCTSCTASSGRSWASACAPATSRSPSRPPRSTPPATCARATARSKGAAAGSARAAAGSRSAARGWCTRTCSAPSATTRAAVTGFAFGMGLSRMAMLKYEVDDLRSFYENDARFLAQFADEGLVQLAARARRAQAGRHRRQRRRSS